MIRKTFIDKFEYIASSKQLVDFIIKDTVIKKFKKGDIILKEHFYVQQIPLVVSGIVKVYKEEENGNEVLLYYIKPGESCIMSILAVKKNIPVNIKAIIEEEAELILISKKNLEYISKNFKQWNIFVYSLFNDKFDEVINRIKLLTFSNTEKRILDYLNRIAILTKSNSIYKSHQEIANELGTSREVISRILKKLENQDKIILTHRKIELL